MVRRAVAVGVLLALLAGAGCGGDQSGSASDSTIDRASRTAGGSPGDTATVVADAAEMALDHFGDLTTAASAILRTYEAGASFDEIVADIRADTLTVRTSVGGEPEVAVAGIVARRPLPSADEFDVDEAIAVIRALQRDFLDSDDPELLVRTYLRLILWAIEDGQPLDAIVEGIVLGDFTRETRELIEERKRAIRPEVFARDLEHCKMVAVFLNSSDPPDVREAKRRACIEKATGSTIDEIFDPDGELATTATSDDGEAAPGDTAAPTPAAEAGGVYRGTGLHRKTFVRAADGMEFACEHEPDMELRLDPDGTATFTYFAGLGLRIEPEDWYCVNIDGSAWAGGHDATERTFAIAPASDALDSWEFGGSFGDDAATGSGTYTYSDSAGVSTVEFEFTLDRS